METTLGIFIVALVFVAAYAIDKLWDRIPSHTNDWYDIKSFAEYAVQSAKVATGSTSNEELGNLASAALKEKFPKIKDVDLNVAIGSSLAKLTEGSSKAVTPD